MVSWIKTIDSWNILVFHCNCYLRPGVDPNPECEPYWSIWGFLLFKTMASWNILIFISDGYFYYLRAGVEANPKYEPKRTILRFPLFKTIVSWNILIVIFHCYFYYLRPGPDPNPKFEPKRTILRFPLFKHNSFLEYFNFTLLRLSLLSAAWSGSISQVWAWLVNFKISFVLTQ